MHATVVYFMCVDVGVIVQACKCGLSKGYSSPASSAYGNTNKPACIHMSCIGRIFNPTKAADEEQVCVCFCLCVCRCVRPWVSLRVCKIMCVWA